LSAEWILLLFPGLIWGASYLFIAEGLDAVGPAGITLVRIAFGFATLAFFRSARNSVARADWGQVIWLGISWFAFPLLMFPFAQQHISSAMTGMLNGANPLFATLVAAVIVKRMPSTGVLAGLALGMAGTALMALPSMHQGHSSAVGVAMILAAMVSYGFALNLAGPLQQKYGAVPVIWRAQAVGLLLTAPFGIPDVLTAQWMLIPWLSLLALGVLGTGIAYVAMASASGRFGAARSSSVIFIIPVVAVMLGLLVRNEKVEMIAVIGGVICLLGAWLMKRSRSY
jgi:drug/metabolite transporter (DMT)-like permease